MVASLLNPRERFIDRLLVLRGDREAVTVSYGPHGSDTGSDLATVNHLGANPAAIDGHVSRLRKLCVAAVRSCSVAASQLVSASCCIACLRKRTGRCDDSSRSFRLVIPKASGRRRSRGGTSREATAPRPATNPVWRRER